MSLPCVDFRSTQRAIKKRTPIYRQKKTMTVSGLNIVHLLFIRVRFGRSLYVGAFPGKKEQQDNKAPGEVEVVKDGFRVGILNHGKKGPREQDETEKEQEDEHPRFA
jgi:hypothetical protein